MARGKGKRKQGKRAKGKVAKPSTKRKLTDRRIKRLTLATVREYLWKYHSKKAAKLGWGKSKSSIPASDVADIRFIITEAYAKEDADKGRPLGITIARVNEAVKVKWGDQLGGKAPALPEGMTREIPYWDLPVYLGFILQASPRIHFTSTKILGKETTLRGATSYSYSETFQPFVDKCNELYRKEPYRDLGSGERILIVTSPPRRDNKGKWRSIIQVVNEVGEQLIVPSPPKQPEGKPAEPKEDKDADSDDEGFESEELALQKSKEAEVKTLLEVEREKSMQKIMDLYLADKISEERFNKMMKMYE